MNHSIHFSMQAVLLLYLTLLSGLAQSTPGAMPSPRTFCEQRGGTITETGDPDVYICCYEQQQKCLASNTRLSQSVLVDLPWNTTVGR